MTETVDRNVAAEEKKGGLVIRKALYGKLVKDNEDIRSALFRLLFWQRKSLSHVV